MRSGGECSTAAVSKYVPGQAQRRAGHERQNIRCDNSSCKLGVSGSKCLRLERHALAFFFRSCLSGRSHLPALLQQLFSVFSAVGNMKNCGQRNAPAPKQRDGH